MLAGPAGAAEWLGEAGVDQLIIHMQMGNMPHERIMESIETLGTEVLPKYR